MRKDQALVNSHTIKCDESFWNPVAKTQIAIFAINSRISFPSIFLRTGEYGATSADTETRATAQIPACTKVDRYQPISVDIGLNEPRLKRFRIGAPRARFTDSSLKQKCLALSDPPRGLVQTYERENCTNQGKESNKGEDCQYWSSLEFRVDATPQQVVESKDRNKNCGGNEESQH